MRARSMTSTVLGTSEIARSVRVAVTTTRSNSVASASAGAASAAEDSPWARAMPGSARHSADDNRLGRLEGLDENGDSRPAGVRGCRWRAAWRSEEHTSELPSLMRISHALFRFKKNILNK